VTQPNETHALRNAGLLVSVLALVACGSSSNSPSSSPIDAGIDGAAGQPGTGDASAAVGDAGAAVSDPTSCESYCTDITALCKGVNAQYRDMANCMKACSYLPPGKADDVGVDSIGCRHAEAIMAAFDAKAIKPECWYAGPFAYGACGPACEPFCTIALAYCSAAEGYTGKPPYASLDECLAVCGQLGRVLDYGAPGSYGVGYTPGPTTDTTDTFECRGYHLVVNALKSEMYQQIHCPHAAPVSEVCGSGPALGPQPDAGADAP
jgi:hypothetical protein